MASTTPNYTQTLIPIFDGEGYEFWSIKMKTIFISQDLWGAIEEAFQEATPEEQSTWAAGRLKEYKQTMQKDAKALSLIQQGVSNAIFPRIMNAKTAKEAWEILKGQYKGSDKIITIKLQSLWKDFETLLMKEGESIQAFFSRVSNIVNQIRSNGDTIEDKKIVQKILRSLPAKFDHVVAAIEEAKDLTKLTLVELEGSLRAHEERMQKLVVLTT
ncbi:putative RNA-directed DNA polymerase [Senna tora]|uniref:Putative RNA-directed DNA polymerase n=1 Tax=Senna tora TaxID=362788 RepID=A0A834XDC9_9FABA|nr:putative RNA-directed DNA polymerase [Senna tora]